MRLFEGTAWDVPPRCERCGKLTAECACPPAEPAPPPPRVPPEQQTAKLAVEKRGGGKMVTVVRGLRAADNDFAELLSQLKAGCGAGGTAKDDTIEIQGRQLDRVRELLAKLGYKTKG
ncbi:MAG: translation initiation factor [Planctomycetes bacterium]|nr:translation initiation factor [Planctomycetota bacterium]